MNKTGIHSVVGKLAYFSPEQVEAFFDGDDKIALNLEKCDIYSLGILFLKR